MHKVFTGNLGNKIDITRLSEMIEPLNSEGTMERLGETSQNAPLSELTPAEEKVATPTQIPISK